MSRARRDSRHEKPPGPGENCTKPVGLPPPNRKGRGDMTEFTGCRTGRRLPNEKDRSRDGTIASGFPISSYGGEVRDDPFTPLLNRLETWSAECCHAPMSYAIDVPFSAVDRRTRGTSVLEPPVMQPTLEDLIASADRGDRSAADALFAALYAELHRLARRELARHQAHAGLGATTLLHEAYLAISNREGAVFPDRARFMAYAARVMRGLIIDDVRGRLAQKRGGGMHHTTFVTDVVQRVEDPQALERLSDALDELATHDAALAEIVDLRFFCGFSFAEIAALRGVSERTVKRSWEKSRIYLYGALGSGSPVR